MTRLSLHYRTGKTAKKTKQPSRTTSFFIFKELSDDTMTMRGYYFDHDTTTTITITITTNTNMNKNSGKTPQLKSGSMSSYTRSITVATFLCLLSFNPSQSFQVHNHQTRPFLSKTSSQQNHPRLSTSLPMVFDFFKKRAEEGVEQLSNLSNKASKGKLSEGLVDLATYTKLSNEAFAEGLAKSRNKLLYELDTLRDGSDFLEDLEDVLLRSDIGIKTSTDVMEEVRSLREDNVDYFTRDDLRSVLRGKLMEALETEQPRSLQFSTEGDSSSGLTVWFIMGANGMGKTTTIGKLAHRLKSEGDQKVMVAACDTFRAGAVDQLKSWADRSQVTCFSPLSEGDSGSRTKATSPSAVLYGALDKALAENYDTLIVDTSGRLSNNDALTKELVKMKKVIQKRLSDGEVNPDTNQPVFNTRVPHETLLVIDAAQGRMALDSARQWHQEIGLTGLILTKLDGSARGGSVVAVSRELKFPVKLVGVGEGIEDLRDFEPESFVDGLLGIGSTSGKKSKEGKILSKRLTDMRKLRDERAKIKKITPTAAAVPQEEEQPTQTPQEPAAPKANNRNTNKNKKKKKKKKQR